MISMTINGTTVNIEQNTEHLEDATEEFDVGSCLIVNTTDREPYPDFSDIVITMGSYTINTILQKDTSSRLASGLYQHQLVFTEYALKLALYHHPDRKFDTVDGDRTTYEYHLDTILGSIVGYLDKTLPLTVATATRTLLDEYADEKEYTQGNLLLTLIDMFRYVNAIPTLDEDNVIGHKLLSDLGDEVTFDRIDGEVIESDIADYGYRVYSKLKNATYESDLITGGTYFPGENGSVSPRSLTQDFTDVNAVYILDTNVRRMISGKAIGLGGTYSNVELKIVSKEEWDNLEINRTYGTVPASGSDVYEDDYKNNTLYHVDNVIYNLWDDYDYSSVLVNADNKRVVNQAIRRAIYLAGGSILTDYSPISTPRTLYMRFFYQPQRDMDITQVRYDYDRVSKNATVLNNQKDSIVELNRYGTANKQYINRIGNDKYQVTVRYFDRDNPTPFNVFDYTSDGYKIIKRQFIWRGTSFDVIYELTKNQSILNPITGVKYESVSPYTITQKSILTNFIREGYYEFSRTNKTDTNNDNSNVRRIMLNALTFNATYDTPIWNATYRRGVGDYISMPCSPVPMGQSFEFNVQFYHPKFAGYQLESYTTSLGGTAYQIVPLSYTDEYGQAGSIRLGFTNEPTSTSVNTYPLSTGFGTQLFDTTSFDADLQPNERLGHTEVRHCISDISGFVVGDYFLQNNSLIKTLGVAQTYTVGIYDESQNITIYDQKIKNSPDSTGTFTYTLGNDYFDISGGVTDKSWIIYNSDSGSDDYGKIYLAFNRDDSLPSGTGGLSRVYINYLEDDPNIETL